MGKEGIGHKRSDGDYHCVDLLYKVYAINKQIVNEEKVHKVRELSTHILLLDNSKKSWYNNKAVERERAKAS